MIVSRSEPDWDGIARDVAADYAADAIDLADSGDEVQAEMALRHAFALLLELHGGEQ